MFQRLFGFYYLCSWSPRDCATGPIRAVYLPECSRVCDKYIVLFLISKKRISIFLLQLHHALSLLHGGNLLSIYSTTFTSYIDICDSGWNYFDGHCYFTSKTCANWTTALRNCRNENAAITDVKSSEENVFIQHRHNGEKSWLGLNDRTAEGNFTWADRGRGNFTAWAKNQPNNFKEEDCVHALGIKYRYEWNDVKCSDCHQYTCKKGKVFTSLIKIYLRRIEGS